MTDLTKLKYLRVALVLIGIFFIVGIYPAMVWFPSGWVWTPRQPEYEQMILGIYATLGVFLLLSVRNPNEHRSLIWFAVWSSIVHAVIMFIQSLEGVGEHAHLYGDIPALFFVAFILAVLMPRKKKIA